MAFLLQHLPDTRSFSRFKALYPELDPAAVAAFLRLLRVGSDLLAELDALLEPHGITHGRWITMILLRREEHHSALPSDLAAKQGVTRATMSGLLAGLEHAGLIRRQPGHADARCSAAILTPRGVRLLDNIMPGYYTAVSRWLAPLSTDEQLTLAAMLDRLRAGVSDTQAKVVTMPPHAPAGPDGLPRAARSTDAARVRRDRAHARRGKR